MAYPDPLLLDYDGGTTDRTFHRVSDGLYTAEDSNLGAPHQIFFRHKAFRSGSGNVDQHQIHILRSEEDSGGTIARAELKLTVNIPQKVLTDSQVNEVRLELIDFLSSQDSWDRLLRSET